MIAHRALLRQLRPWAVPTQAGPACGWLGGALGHSIHSSAPREGTGASEGWVEGSDDRDKSYIDRLKVTARAGRGGNGCVSFWRSAAKGKHAPADGGNGGDGGDVVLRACANMKSLAGVQQLYKAEPGGHGSKQKQHGRAGKNTVVLVPVGTVVSQQQLPREETEAAGPGPGSDLPGSSSSGSSGGSSASERDGGGGAAPSLPLGGPAFSHMGPRRRLAHRVGGGQPGNTQEQGELRPASEEEMPEWIRRWRQPWVGARDYRSEEEESEWEGGDSAAGAAGGGSGQPRGRAWEEGYRAVADLVQDGQEVVVARGGRGGRGNAAFRAQPNRPAPKTGEQGQLGEVARLLLELKLLADVGLVGLPNAGKSTLLRAISNATPRVGSYAFTTLAPQLGVVFLGEDDDNRVVVADIPGLIEGASQNRGLGHHFLRHIERTKALAYVVDASAGLNGAPGVKPWDALDLLQHEILEYSERLDTLPALVVANKIDLLPRPAAVVRDLQRRTDLPVVAVSAREHKGIQELLAVLRRVMTEGE